MLVIFSVSIVEDVIIIDDDFEYEFGEVVDDF